PGWALWTSRVLARRGDFEEAGEVLERPEVVAVGYGRDYLLEARCTLVAEREAWDAAGRIADEARRHAETAGLLALPLVADRLDGLAEGAAGDAERAAALLRGSA